ncbi:hypothetical protein [Sphingomonas sp. TDK1]|uniref:hypothetical protein n=1 Tax=Sphingomonas sp. TDK1 TaxID=453247 RepID=UPI000B056D54|nr:hypothetical protein [Sphingomonas sp. TDK1]
MRPWQNYFCIRSAQSGTGTGMKHALPLLFCCAAAFPALAQPAPQTAQIRQEAQSGLPSYATVATAIVGAPLVIDARISDMIRIKENAAPGLASGRARLYVTADVLALIRGGSALPTQISYLADVPLDSRGKLPKLKKQRVLLFARPTGKTNEVQLTGIDSQYMWTPELDALTRGITRELLASDAPPAVTGIGNAFHVPGALPGEGETQVFVKTANGAPISLQILRRPGEKPRWGVSLGDIVDPNAGAPKRNTLAWYRLACGLPKALPNEAVSAETPDNAEAARQDYQVVLRELGPCA